MKLVELYEAKVSAANKGAALGSMVSYLGKKLGGELIKLPGIEKFHNSKESGEGYRYILKGSPLSIRFNWTGTPGSSANLKSIDVWTGTSRDPNFNISVEGKSFVKFLPQVAKLLAKPKLGKHLTFAIDNPEVETVTEAAKGDFTAEQALDAMLKKLERGGSFTRSEFAGQFHTENVGVFDEVINHFAEHFDVKGKRLSAKPETWKNIDSLRKQILESGDFITVSAGGSDEEYEPTAGEKAIAEKVPFKETLDHLDGLVKGLAAGAFNALFVAGKGGTGKTQTVEDALHEQGLMDGYGYFKNSGTASAAGLYNLLYHNRKNILLFDDSDGALNDQDARNILKAATDTKKKRKLVWNKKSSFIFDPDAESAEEYEDDTDMAPKHFEFEGRIIFISNLPLNKLDPDGALRTRAFVINVDPTDEELYERMEEILHDIKLEDGLTLTKEQRENVMKVVKSSKRQSDVSLRKLVRALNLAASGAPNWEKLVDLYA